MNALIMTVLLLLIFYAYVLVFQSLYNTFYVLKEVSVSKVIGARVNQSQYTFDLSFVQYNYSSLCHF